MPPYKLLRNGMFYFSGDPGRYAGWAPGMIFGLASCKSGMRMRKENRVWFADLEDAVREGYRPCQKCRPMSEAEFERLRHLVPERTLEEFYSRKERRRS